MKLLLTKLQFVLLCLYLLPAIHLWGAHPALSDSLADNQTADILELAITQKYADDSHAAGPLVDFVVYFKKPADWVAPIRVHYWNRLPGNTSTTWPGEVMTACPAGGDWYFFEFNGTTSTNLLFNDANGLQTADLSRSEDGWYDGAWLASPPAYFTCLNCTTDVDMDGICAGADCDDMDANVPAAPGTACDDGDPNTANDQIQADSCSCQGYGSFTVYFKKPGHWSAPINVHYWDRQPENTSSTWPGEQMTLCGNDWWSYTFTATASTNLLFHDGTGNESGDLSRSSEGWYNNGWVSTGSCTRGGVEVSPTVPTPDEMVTITFDATGSHLAGASQVYFHSGVSITEGEVTNFDRAIGNWGQDDGVGEMVFLGDNIWEISLTSLRDYYAVAETEDVFGLNFLFRSADGSVVEDQGGANYHNPVNTGSYFTIVSPEDQPHLIPLGSSFNLTAGANTAADSWLFEEVDAQGVPIATIGMQTGGDTATQSITLQNTTIRYFKVTANFASGPRYKLVTAKAYAPICTTPRPAGTQAGINYDPNDPTKATLVLHTPTYTRYKKGTGVVTGMGNTPPKEVVYVLGDFNNWSLDDAYQLCRDTDGWNGTTDTDGDDDRGDYWWIELTGLTPGQPYVFQYLVDGNLQVADPYAEQISDPDDAFIDERIYPNLPQFPAEAGGRRASVLQTQAEAYTWTAPTFNRPTNNHLNIYELHFRDFTEEGTYLAAIDRLDYLKDLGINAVHVMPVSEFEGNSSWGYNPNFYFAADKAYGTKNDLKKFIDECHKREIQVFNDLVLNHAFYSNVMARLYWDDVNNKPATNNPWFNADHRAVADPAGWWGADWNHESEHVQNMIDRILDYWLSEFQFDGFRFDFTKGFTQTGQDPGDPWASTYDQDRIDLLKRMVDNMWAAHPGSVAIFEHLANNDEDRELANHGILMWSGAGHHGAMKNWMLGFNQDDPNIYSTGIYNTPDRNFQFANWMSYMESHDEERQAYEVLHYGNTIADEPDPTLKLAKAIDRLKLGAAFNLFFPGPRMIWELEELGYDFSINYNGRTGEKPTTWDYFEDGKRRELYRIMSTILRMRNTYNLYALPPIYDNISWGPNAIDTPRRMILNDGQGHVVIIIGNLDPVNGHTATPGYYYTGNWYRYTGEVDQDGTIVQVDNLSDTYYLEPSEVVILTNFNFDNEILDESKIQVAARLYLSGAYEDATGLMRDQLRADGVLPLTEPYSGQGYTFVGGGGETVTPAVLAVTGSDAIVDWVAVELRSATNPTTVVASRAALLQRDGDVVDLDGVSTTLDFVNTPPGNYYLVIKHRNHLEISTSEAHFFHPVAFTMDFTKHTATYGTNAQKLMSNGLYGCWPGDANSNSQVQNTDIENYWRPSVGTSGYLPADFNLNGQVQNTDLELHWKTAVGRGAQLPD